MKRSEMLNIIKIHLDTECGLDFLAMQPIDVAKQLLTLMESKGMLPPRIKVEESRTSINPEGEQGTFVSWTYKSKWEPEDETTAIKS